MLSLICLDNRVFVYLLCVHGLQIRAIFPNSLNTMKPSYLLITGILIIIAAGIFNAAFFHVPNPYDTPEIAAQNDSYETIFGILCGIGFSIFTVGVVWRMVKMSKNI